MATHQSRAISNTAKAKDLAAAGFTNEARRKEALYYLSNAYHDLKRLVSDATWAAIRSRENSEAEERDWDLTYPYELHNVRDKHHAYAREMAPACEEQIVAITELKALRDAYRAQPLLVKVVKPVVIREGDRIQHRGHCQCCARLQAVNGTMAKHGYQVKHRGMGGFFTSVCTGEHHKPMEYDRTRADDFAAELRDGAVRCNETADKLESGQARLTRVTVGIGSNRKAINFEDATPREQAAATAEAVRAERFQARELTRFADHLQATADKVHGKPLKVVKLNKD